MAPRTSKHFSVFPLGCIKKDEGVGVGETEVVVVGATVVNEVAVTVLVGAGKLIVLSGGVTGMVEEVSAELTGPDKGGTTVGNNCLTTAELTV
jgi:hypothetical protein